MVLLVGEVEVVVVVGIGGIEVVVVLGGGRGGGPGRREAIAGERG